MISCVILTHNNEDSIGALLANVSFCDERIVVDDYSTDNTVAYAKEHKVIVLSRALGNDFAAQRNAGLEKAKGEWVLFVDSDETVSEALKKDIIAASKKDDGVSGYYFLRRDILFGRELKYGETAQVRLIRMAKKGSGIWKRAVHEVWDVRGARKTFTSPLLHSPHPTVKTFLSQINRYTTINASVFFKEGKRSHVLQIIFYPIAKFFQNYVWKLGFLDGTAGFVSAMMMSFHSFLTRGKLWELSQKKVD